MKRSILFLFSFTIFTLSCRSDQKKIFELIDSKESGLNFNNTITENDTLNILEYEYIYNGGGVAVADFDNDGLEDLYFTGNMVENKLFRNKGNLKFEDVTEKANCSAKDFWCSGVNIVDINQDGKKDIYISTNTHKESKRRTNLLYINITPVNGPISFVESANEYGIADTSYCMNSIFFDYDNDLDLDLLVITNKTQRRDDVSIYTRGKHDILSGNLDILYRNDFDSKKGHPVFTDVSAQAGINLEGFSLGVNVADINQDGWKDIYISNDFISNDILFINNKNGTFTNRIKDYLSHTCMSAMGNDIVDLNNDGLLDIVALDMLPEDNYRRKTMMPSNNYNSYINNNDYDYMHQFNRNVLQLNRGYITELKHNVFSEIANYAGISSTDWSWTPLCLDFDMDGYKDIIITNGFPKDVTDKDFMDYKAANVAFVNKKEILTKIPEVKIKNYAYKNNGNLTFNDVTSQWGIETPSFSNGAAYVDLDNDGDMDYVVNNINDVCHLYCNKMIEYKSKNNFVKLKLNFKKPNLNAVGSVIKVSFGDQITTYEFNSSRGYLSSMQDVTYIGLGDEKQIKIEVIWPNGRSTILQLQEVNKVVQINYDEVSSKPYDFSAVLNSKPYFELDESIARDSFAHRDYNDYNIDPLLLFKKSNKGSVVEVGDINFDGLEDYFITGSILTKPCYYLQNVSGRFDKYAVELNVENLEKEQKNAALIDLDNDGDKDVYIVCGSSQVNQSDKRLADIILINENGLLVDKKISLPIPPMNSSFIEIADFDGDSDDDILLGGDVIPFSYPLSEKSILLKNEGTKGKILFKQVELIGKQDLGMVQDAKFVDYNGDGKLDIVCAVEWEGLKFFKNVNNSFKEDEDFNSDLYGWWTTIECADLDGDGDQDLVVGNMGKNTIVQPSQKYPTKVYAKDFDKNGGYDFLISTYFKNSKGVLEEYPYHSKGDVVKELNGFRKKYLTHQSFSEASFNTLLDDEMKKDVKIFEVNEASSGVFINDKNKKFDFKPLPREVQFSSVNAIVLSDIDRDGKIDIVASGNNFGYELSNGRLDASIGSLLLNKGGNNFLFIGNKESGLLLNGDCRDLKLIKCKGGEKLISTLHNGKMKAYNLQNIK